MQKPQIVFSGQVKQGSENWKHGRVEFVVDDVSGTWNVRLYHMVNPNHVVHQQQKLPLGKKAPILFRCNRLIINALNIKIRDSDVKNAQRLVTKITSHNNGTPTFNRAEVGLSSSQSCMSGSKIKSQSLTPNGISSTPGWISKTTPPSSVSSSHTVSSAKRKIQLDSPTNGDNSNKSNSGQKRHSDWLSKGEYVFDDDDLDDIEEDTEVTFHRKYTGMKDYAQRPNMKKTNGLPNGLGARSFYGAQNSLLADNAYRGLTYKTSPVNPAPPKSPRSKKAKLSELDADQENKVVVSERSKALLKERMVGKVPMLSDPQDGDAVDGDNPGASHESSSHTSDIQAVGFDNLGNTCFMNSPLQCLSSLEPLSLDIQTVVSQFGRLLPTNSVTRMLYLLMKDVRKLDVRPERVREILTRLRNDINSKFEYNTQQDAHELLSELLDRTDEEVKAVLADKNVDENNGITSTPTEANFTWLFKTSFYFHDCKTEILSQLEEKDTTLMLPLDSKSLNLQDCVDKYFESTEVDMQCDKCEKREKATMTRKIIKRPRCFILNLLRYHSHEREAKKKLDCVTIPRYMSVVEYCAEDVKVAPAIGPVFMLDRIPASAVCGSTQEPPESARVAAVEVARRGREAAIEMARQRDDDPSRWRIRQIANELCDHFDEIYEQLNIAQEAMEDMTVIYENAQTLVVSMSKSLENGSLMQSVERYFQDRDWGETSEEELTHTKLCMALLSRAVVEPGNQDDEVDLYRLLKRLVAYRYKSVPNKIVQINHLTHDLAMYLAAKDVGMIMVDSPKRRRLSSREEGSDEGRVRHRSGSDHSYEFKDRRRRRPSGLACQEEVCMEGDKGENTSGDVNRSRTVRQGERSSGVSGTDAESESWSTEGTFGRRKPRRIVGMRRGGALSDDEGISGDSSKCGSATQAGRRHSDSDCKDNDNVCEDLVRLAEEASSGAMADVSNNATMNTTTNLDNTVGGDSIDIGYTGCGPEGKSGEQHLHNRPISEWTEEELKMVNPEALTDEEVLVYVQALSKFDYIREQQSHFNSASKSVSFHTMEYTADQDLGLTSEPDESHSTGLGCRDGNMKVVSERDSCEEESTDFRAVGEINSNLADSLETMVGDLKDTDSVKSRGSPKDSDKKGGKIPELHCEETLSDIDEVDFGGDNSEVRNTRLRSGQSFSESSEVRTGRSTGRRFAGRSCSHCGQPVLRDRKVCSCRTPSPKKSATSAGSGMVLSPSKNVINQRNRTTNSGNKVSSPSPSRRALSPRSGAQTAPSQSPAGVTVDKSKTTPVSLVSPRMDTLSQSKSARSDLARLRSPNSVSPRRRAGRDPSTSSGRNTPSSASKRLNFEHEAVSASENEEHQIDMSPPKDKRLDDMSIGELGLLDGTLARSGAADFGDDGDFGDIPPLSPIKASKSGAGSHCPQNSPLKSPAKSSLRGGCGDAGVTEANNPVPVPVTGSPLNSSINVKQEPSTKEEARPRRILPPTPLKSVDRDRSPNSKENVVKGECKGASNDGDAISPYKQEGACHDEKENFDTLARRERLENIESGKADSSYRLVGIVNHHGESLVAGHYTAFSFNFNKQRWFFMDDKHARQTSEGTARDESANSGYVFFYMDKELFHQYAQTVAERRPTKEDTPSAKSRADA